MPAIVAQKHASSQRWRQHGVRNEVWKCDARWAREESVRILIKGGRKVGACRVFLDLLAMKDYQVDGNYQFPSW
ncbi:hypothetical protein [Oxalicibacterium flavum]|uniref:hypothetical protein n=1 Tax=Oxalicibacterium flavum TaxID=179467 RepID=UPI00166777BF|nr:hypothetical protein [Oxalicibacterium flavum]